MLVAINGFLGQMGQKVFEEMAKADGFEFAGGVDRLGREKRASVENLPERVRDKIFDNLFRIGKCEGVIDFSHPSALNGVLNFCLDRRVPLVIATTGLGEGDRRKVEFASRYIPVFMASNLSLGVQVVSDLVGKACEGLKDYDIQIVETHHSKKVDAPSGTAKMLISAIGEAESGAKGVGVHSLRGGGVVGEHEVRFLGQYDEIRIVHTAFSREMFAQGALEAMRFLKGKRNGLYGMRDLLNSQN